MMPARHPHPEHPTVIIIQARMRSERLPGKVLIPILGRPMLGRQLDRLRRCRRVDEIVVAVPDSPSDDVLAEFVAREGVRCYRGSEADVLGRYRGAALESNAKTVVRVTADCPVIDPAVVDSCVGAFHDAAGSTDYLSNTQRRTFPRGMDTEVFTRAALEAAHLEADRNDEREHVTPFVYRRPQRFRLRDLLADRDESRYRLTVDTPADLQLLNAVFEALLPTRPEFALQDIVELLAGRPDLVALNAHVEQRPTTLPTPSRRTP